MQYEMYILSMLASSRDLDKIGGIFICNSNSDDVKPRPKGDGFGALLFVYKFVSQSLVV